MSLAEYFVGNAIMSVTANRIIVVTNIEGAAVEAGGITLAMVAFHCCLCSFCPSSQPFLIYLHSQCLLNQ